MKRELILSNFEFRNDIEVMNRILQNLQYSLT